MKQTNIQERKRYAEVVDDIPTPVQIPNTKKTVYLCGLKPYTLERLTGLWRDRDLNAIPDDTVSTLKSIRSDSYFTIKAAILFVLNDYWKIIFFFRIMVWWWSKVLGYTEEQIAPIIVEGKKKVPLTAHWKNMVYLTDMRTDRIKMTKKEAEQYLLEQILDTKHHLSKSSPAMEEQGDSSSAS